MKNQLPPVLDACCGGRMFWFDKQNPLALYCDIRKGEYELCDGRKFSVSPDMIADFRNLPFDDESFSLVVFDPPHLLKIGGSSWMAQKYGALDKDNWQDDIKKGFSECMRVLKPNGTLVFKWNERDIKLSELLKVIGQEPLFGHTTTKSRNTTYWMCFLKEGTK